MNYQYRGFRKGTRKIQLNTYEIVTKQKVILRKTGITKVHFKLKFRTKLIRNLHQEAKLPNKNVECLIQVRLNSYLVIKTKLIT